VNPRSSSPEAHGAPADPSGLAGFSRRGLAILIVFGLGTFGLGLVLAGFSGDLFGYSSYGADTYSHSLVGHRALAASLEPNLALAPDAEALESGPSTLADADQERRAVSLYRRIRASGAPLVLALPKREVHPSPVIPGWIAEEDLIAVSVAERPLSLLSEVLEDGSPARTELSAEAAEASSPPPQPATDEPLRVVRVDQAGACRAEALGLPSARVEAIGPLQLLAPTQALEPLAECAGGVLIGRLRRAPGPPVILVSEPDLLNNRGLTQGDHAALVHRLLERELQAAGVVIDETLHGHLTGQGLLSRALGFPLGLLSAHVALSLLLAGWWLAGRFGRSLPAPPALPPGKVLLIENTAMLLHSSSDHRAALKRYLQGVLQELDRRCAAVGQGSGATDEERLLSRLQALGRAQGLAQDPHALARAARNPGLPAPEALRLARRIHAWRAALLGQAREPAAKHRRS
jgi:hypothetical protein